MKRYELKLVEGGKGVFKVSVVKDPAIESTLVHFSAEKEEKHFFTDEEKKVIYSVVMRPNMDIFRKDINGEPANVYYTSETVEQAQINYFRNNGNSATNINHSDIADAEGIFPFESWIVSDSKTDRAVNFGLDVQEGDWVMGFKVDNDELWSEHIKTGKLDGFSVEATNINYELKEEVQMSKDKKGEEPKKKSIWEQMDEWFKARKEEFALDEDEKEEEKEEEMESKEEDKEDEEMLKDKSLKAEDEDEDEVEKETLESVKAELADALAMIATLKADAVKADTELEIMKKQTPSVAKIKNLPEPVKLEMTAENYSKMTNVQKMRFNRENKQY